MQLSWENFYGLVCFHVKKSYGGQSNVNVKEFQMLYFVSGGNST